MSADQIPKLPRLPRNTTPQDPAQDAAWKRRQAGLLVIAQDVRMRALGTKTNSPGPCDDDEAQARDVAILRQALREWHPTEVPGHEEYDQAVWVLVRLALRAHEQRAGQAGEVIPAPADRRQQDRARAEVLWRVLRQTLDELGPAARQRIEALMKEAGLPVEEEDHA